jgi:hypothetical protein
VVRHSLAYFKEYTPSSVITIELRSYKELTFDEETHVFVFNSRNLLRSLYNRIIHYVKYAIPEICIIQYC